MSKKKRSTSPKPAVASKAASQTPARKSVPPNFVVGVGASAGGLEPLEAFFANVPEDSEMAYVVVQHLSPEFKSLMDELLARRTTLPIHRAENGMPVHGNAVYLIPPKKDMTIAGGKLVLVDQERTGNLNLPIDTFFHSLAKEFGDHAVAVLLSGSGSDGSRGLVEVATAGGLVIVQDPDTAKFDSMPKNAIGSGLVDWVLPVERIPAALHHYGTNPLAGRHLRPEDLPPSPATELDEIRALLREQHDLDFGYYKNSTFSRRIQRRMMLGHHHDVPGYIQSLKHDPGELRSLYEDLLIGVTTFFRDSDSFRAVEEKAIAKLIARKPPQDPLRVWTAGCSSGQEAYSIAIILLEQIAKQGRKMDLKIFATDVDAKALDVASAGRFTREAVNGISAGRLKRFFTEENGEYVIRKEVRRHIVFAPHNIVSDAPFRNIDLVSCRNLLIYLEPAAQEKVIALLHFALNVEGVLFLGASESVGKLADEFRDIDKASRIYAKRRAVRLSQAQRLPTGTPALATFRGKQHEKASSDAQLLRAYDAVLDDVVPTGLLLDPSGRIIHMFGDIEEYLEPRKGRFSTDAMDLLHHDLRLPVVTASRKARGMGGRATYGPAAVRLGDEKRLCTVTVLSISVESAVGTYEFIQINNVSSLAEKRAPVPAGEAVDMTSVAADRIRELEFDLQQTREQLQSTIEELETSNEELQSTNEELVSSNEELQSTNEELHSVNEELYTVNAEFQQKIAELTELTSDLDNLMSSIDIGVVFLDDSLNIRRFTPTAARSFHLRTQDIGRPIAEITSRLLDYDVVAAVEQVRATQAPIDAQVVSADTSMLLRILPFVSDQHSIEGYILTFVDLTEVRRSEQALRESETRFRTLADSAPVLIWLSDTGGSFEYFNKTWLAFRGRTYESEAGSGWLEGLHEDDRESFESRYRQSLDARHGFQVELRLQRKDGEYRWMQLTGVPRFDSENHFVGYIGCGYDLTERKSAEDELKQRKALLDLVLSATEHGYWDWDISTGEVRFSAGWHESLGYAPEEVEHRIESWRAMCHPDDRHVIEAKLEDHFSGKDRIFACEHRLQLKDGSFRWNLNRGRVVERDAMGRPARMVGTDSDISQIRAAQAELHESRLQLELALRSGEVATWSWDASADRFTADNRLGPLFGLPAGEFPSDVAGLLDLLHPDDAAPTKAAIESAIKSGGVYRVQYRVPVEDGDMRWIEATGHAIRVDGNVTGLAGVCVDITLRKTAEQESQRLREELAMILDNIPSSVWYKDAENRILSVNRAGAAALGYTPDELVGRQCEDFFPDEDARKYLADDREVIRSAKAKLDIVERFMSKSGERWVKTDKVPIPGGDGLPDRLIAISTDITALKQEEELIRRSEATLRRIFEAAPFALLMVDDQGRITLSNQGAEGLFGYTADQLRHQTIEALVPETARTRHMQLRGDYVRNPETRQMGSEMELQAMRRDGTLFPVEVALSPVEFDVGPHVLVAVIDVTQRRESKRKLREYATALERRNQDLDEFSYVASHDLQEPLRNLVSFSQLLEEDLASNNQENVKRDLEAVTRSAQRMRALVNDLLTLSRTAQAERKHGAVHIDACIQDALADLVDRIKQSDARVDVQPHPRVLGDRTLIRQIYYNLLSNALRYGREGVRPNITIGTQRRDGTLVYFVADNGMGIKPEYFDKIFVPFKRLHKRTEIEGSGIGLTICRKAVERHGGQIWVESTPDEGSTFLFTLPGRELAACAPTTGMDESSLS